MLYKILEAVIVLSFLMAIILEVIIGYILIKNDLKYNKKQENRVKIKPILHKTRLTRAEKKKKAEEEKRLETLLNNIDAYNGTDFGQKELD